MSTTRVWILFLGFGLNHKFLGAFKDHDLAYDSMMLTHHKQKGAWEELQSRPNHFIAPDGTSYEIREVVVENEVTHL